MHSTETKSLYLLRKKPIQARSTATVDAILDAGAQLLLTIGYDKASTNKIAEKAKHDPQYAYEDYDGLREKMKNGMLKKDGSFEELLKVYKLD